LENKKKILENQEFKNQKLFKEEKISFLKKNQSELLKEKIRKEIECENLLEKIKIIEKDKQEFLRIKEEFDSYFYFLEASGKNGIARFIINENLHIINEEISKILFG